MMLQRFQADQHAQGGRQHTAQGRGTQRTPMPPAPSSARPSALKELVAGAGNDDEAPRCILVQQQPEVLGRTGTQRGRRFEGGCAAQCVQVHLQAVRGLAALYAAAWSAARSTAHLQVDPQANAQLLAPSSVHRGIRLTCGKTGNAATVSAERAMCG